jgi:phosphoserine phosphatase
MLDLIIVRHGETAWNKSDIFRGRVNIGLSENGLRQAELLAEFLSRKPIQAVYCSPLPRALQTAAAVARRQKLEPQPMPELTDLDFGQWEGLPRQEVQTKYKDLYTQWLDHPELVTPPQGESMEEALKRSLKALDQIMARNKEGKVVIVTHRVITKVLICALLGLDNSHFWNIEQDTCGVTNFIYNDRYFILTHHNDTSFLKDI